MELSEFEDSLFPGEGGQGEEGADEEEGRVYKSGGAAGGITAEESEAKVPDYGSEWAARGEEECHVGGELERTALGWGADVE